MARLLYNDFLIVAGADFLRVTGTWVSIVTISWSAGDKQEIYFLRQVNDRHESAQNAIDFGLARGKAWVEERLKRSK
jgi:hypothetical protein